MTPERAKQERLRSFIAAHMETECQWGIDDCTALAAKWVHAERGIDICLPEYRSKGEAARIIAAAGGLVELWDRYLSPMGVFDCNTPSLGDIGIINTSRGYVGVIFAHYGIAYWRAENGVLSISPRPSTIIKVWSV